MKTLFLIAVTVLLSIICSGQTLIHVDSANMKGQSGTLYYKWYQDKFIDSEYPAELVCRMSLIKEVKKDGIIKASKARTYNLKLKDGDSVKKPGNNTKYFKYRYYKKNIYLAGDTLKHPLSEYLLLEWDERLFE